MYILGIFVHIELLNKIMENIKRNQLLWIPINCSRSVSGISLGFYSNSYYVRSLWLFDWWTVFCLTNTLFDWSLLKMRTSFLLASWGVYVRAKRRIWGDNKKNEKEVIETRGNETQKRTRGNQKQSLLLYNFKDRCLNHGTRFELIHWRKFWKRVKG